MERYSELCSWELARNRFDNWSPELKIFPPLDHKPLTQEEFKGLYSRGVADTAPLGYFTDCLNNKFGESEVLSRDGTVLNLTKSNIVRFFVYKRLNEMTRFIYLDSSGNLYDSLYPSTPIYTDALFVDFSMVNYNNRAYITPHNRVTGIASKSILVYEGGGVARLAGGTAPSGFTLGAANSSSSGSIEEGYHIIAVCYLTSSGFITAPGPTVFALLNAPGAKKADISAIPVGPANTSGRIILSTKSIPVDLYSGNQDGYEFFFVPNGTINNNTSTTLTIDFFDSDLQDSADYLLDNLSTIPAALGVFVYSGRLGTWAENGNEYTVRMSVNGNPETFSSVTGFFTVDPSDGGNGVKNVFEIRKNLAVCESGRIYITSDNGNDPNTWALDAVDKSAGTECFGVSTILDARGLNNDRAWIADRSGLINFEGYVKRPELSYNIEDIWKRINKTKFNLVQVVDDPTNHRILVSVPLDAATAISHILYGDYSKAPTIYGTLDEKAIKWSIWTFPSAPISMCGNTDATTGLPVIQFALSTGIYDLKDGLTGDFGNAISSFIKTDYKVSTPGWIHHFGGMKLRVTGSGSLATTLIGQDNVMSSAGPTFTLNTSPGLEPDCLFNFNNERMAVKFSTVNFNDTYILSRVDIYVKEIWLRRSA